jgi:ATP-dependent helicase/nuclease subunit A
VSAATSDVDDGMWEDERPPWQRGRARTALGRAVHAVLQTVDLATGEGIDALAAAQAAAEGLQGCALQVAERARCALSSRMVLAALDASRYWREFFVAAVVEDLMVEGFIDLLYEHRDGLVIVEYQTDPIPDAQLDALVARCSLQVAAYALALEAVLDRQVVAARFVVIGDGWVQDRAATEFTAAKTTVRAHLRAHHATPHAPSGMSRGQFAATGGRG